MLWVHMTWHSEDSGSHQELKFKDSKSFKLIWQIYGGQIKARENICLSKFKVKELVRIADIELLQSRS